MTGLDTARKNLPSLANLDDEQLVTAMHQMYYPQMKKADLEAQLGYAPPAPPAEQAGLVRTAGDVGIKLAQGVVDVGSAVVGLGSLATGGLVGKGARAIGYDPQRTNAILGEYLSDSQKASDAKVANADGFVDTVAASLQNPRSILGAAAQSAPGMLAGMGVTGAVARGVATKAALATAEGAAASAAELAAGRGAAAAAKAALATRAGAQAASGAVEAAGGRLVALGAATEGAQSAGQIADDAQAAGRQYSDYALPALAAGAGTAAIGLGAGKLMGDSATALATGAQSAGARGGLAARVGKQFVSEGVLEEMPQSAQEQVFTNIAQGESDVLKGVGNAAGTGLVTGGAMGAAMGAAQRTPVVLPNTGPLSQAANAGQAAAAATANATAPSGPAAPTAGDAPAQAAPAAPSLDDIDARMAALVAIGRGSLAQRGVDAAGNAIKLPAVPPRKLTAEETAEYEALKQARAARTAIPADQQAQFQALLDEEAQAGNAKHAAAMQAAAETRAAIEAQQQPGAPQSAAQPPSEDEQLRALIEQDEAEESARLGQALAPVDRRVQWGDLTRAEENRAALRLEVLNNLSIPAEQKKAAFRAALRQAGYTNADLTYEERLEFKQAALPLPSAPNELIDAVPERAAEPAITATPAALAAPNTQAVDDAIAKGMRLKTAGGKVLYKPGSSKVFNLSSAQKAYYEEVMARTAAEQAPPTVPEAAPAALEAAATPAVTDQDTPDITAGAFDAAAHQAATSPHNEFAEPTAAQKEAGNYKLGHATLHGLNLSIENPAGSTRKGVDRDGTPWENTMQHHYGYIKGTVGADKDHIDAFVGPHHGSVKAFVVDQVHPDNRRFDEHKVMLGFNSLEEARDAYLGNYAPDWTGGHRISETTIDGLKSWLAGGKTNTTYVSGAPAGTLGQVADVRENTVRPQLHAVAARLGIAVHEGKNGFHAADGAIVIPDEDTQVGAARTPEHVFAHELGHAIMAKRGISFAGFPAKEMLRFAANWNEIKSASQAYRPEAWKHADQRIRRHAGKPNEILADAIGAVLMNEQPLSLLAPLMESTGIKLHDLGLEDGSHAAQTAAAALAPDTTPTPAPVDKPLTKVELNKLMVSDMTDAQLLQAREVFAGAARAPKIAREISRRGLDAAPTAVVKTAELPDTSTQPTGNDHDPAPSTAAPALDHDLVAEQPAAAAPDARTDQPAGEQPGRADDGGLRSAGRPAQGQHDGAEDLGHAAGHDAVSDRAHDAVASSGERVPGHDFRPAAGELTRDGSWFDTARRNIDLIDLALRIEQEGRPATPDEQAQLAKYVGFGAGEIRNRLFPVPPDYAKRAEPNRLIWPQFVGEPRWRALAERVEALPQAWQKSVLQSSQYAHYTSEHIIRSMWGAIQRLGFTGGKVFEPGMGIGSFAMLMPDSVRATSRYTGVEFDGPTALIAQLLSPEQNMLHDDFIKRKFPRDYFDVAIGNPPFSQTKVFGDPDYAKLGLMLHDFFFAKALDRVRPGGLLAFVTSKGTMDKKTDKARRYLAERADLVGAIRLPSTAFEGNAGTSVVTDVIFLRKRAPGQAPGGEAWTGVQTIDTKDGPVVVNEYFAGNPHMVLGQQRISGNADDMGRRINSNGVGGAQYTVVSYDATPAELDAKFAAAVERLPQSIYSALGQSDESVRRETAKADFSPTVQREGVVYLGPDGTVMRVENGAGRPLAESAKLTEADTAWFQGYVGLRDLVQETRLAQATGGKWQAALKKLNQAYDAFREQHGPINDFRVQVRKSTDEDGKIVETSTRVYKNRRRYREDYDAAVLTQLETINEAGEIVKAPFLLGRTIGVPTTRDVKTVGDALAVSLDAHGKLNLDDVARRIGMSREDAIEALGGQVYRTPAGQWQLADEYLSGDVVAKLEEAEQAARLDPALRRNVDALTAAQPEKLGPSQISAKLGASWISEAHVRAFAQEIEAGDVSFDQATETWQVDGGNLRSERRAGAVYGTAARSPSELLEAVLNSRPIKVTMKVEGKLVTDAEATTAANEMAKKIKDKFKGWVWTDTERASDLVETYNKRFNNLAPRRFDGAYLTLPGVSLRYQLHGHQKNGIARIIQTGDTYLNHAVGAGKTIEMIAAGMEQKRLGLIDKPMYVVPNHMLEQFSNEFMELYPLANIMVADDNNFSAERRQAFIASATMNKPDAVIITHDAFQRIGVTEESIAPIRDQILADLEIELSETAKNNDTRVRRSQLEQQIEAVTQRFDRIVGAGGKDATITFEDMGVDFVFADEAHVYRKLDFHTAQQIKGIDPNGSKRALDMYVKTRILQQRRPGRAMVFASGTPVTNTMGELYTIMRFFAPEELDRAGIATFDAWSRQFGEVSPALEPNAAGRYEMVERFSKFDNVPELMSRVRQFMDVLTSEHLGALVKRPDLEGGKPRLNIVQPTEQLEHYMKGELAQRIERSKRWRPTKDEPNNPDPVVAIITDGRFAAIDPRFFGGKLAEGESSIITTMADGVLATYHATKDNVYLDRDGKPEVLPGSTQMVFYNLGFGEQSQASRGFNARAAFTKRLTEGGIPREQIAWFDEANTDAKKEAIFKAMRSGQLRVLIGSAKKMGTGVNAQKRLIKLHYQDPPWFPSDVEQPHGRIIRQGNQNGEVGIEWYTTKGTYQSTMWQMVARKQRFIDQAFTGDKTLRSMDDLGEASMFEQAAAVASGDPRAIQLAGLKQEVHRLERLQSAHASEQIAVRHGLLGAEFEIKSAKATIATLGAAFKVLGERQLTYRAGTVGGTTYDKPGEFGQAIKDAFNAVATGGRAVQDREIGRLGDIAITMDAELDRDGQPTGDYTLAAQVGQLTRDVTAVGTFGAGADAAGLTRRIINAVNAIDSELRAAKLRLVASETDMTRLQRKRGAPFEYQQELAEKYGDLQRLQEELRLEGQAPAAAPADATPAADAQPGAPAQDAEPADYFRRDGSFAPPALDALQQDNDGAAPASALSTAELVQAKRDTERLNRKLAAAGLAPVRALRTAPNARFALARQIGKALGVDVHYVSKNDAFEGVTHQGVAYLTEGMAQPELAIAGHEMLHALEHGDPDLGRQLRQHVRAYLRDGVVTDRQLREHVASGFQDVSESTAEREVLADINGAMWLDPRFWSSLAQADRSLFRAVAYKFMEVASKLVSTLRGSRFDVTQLVTDVDAVRALMVQAWAQHTAAKNAPRAAAPAAEWRGAIASGSVPLVQTEWLAETRIAQEVTDRIGQFAHQPPIRILDSAVGFLDGVTARSGVEGAVQDGVIYLFRDQLRSVADVQRVLFHELLHYGLERFLTKNQYITRMHQLYERDAQLRGWSDAWLRTAKGQQDARDFGREYALAVAVDEGLAQLAQGSAGQFQKNSLVDRSVRTVIRWLAALAQSMRMPKLASRLRGMKNEEARALIRSMFSQIEHDAPPADPWRDSGEGFAGVRFSQDPAGAVAPVARPDVLIAAPLGALAAHADYPAAKAGDAQAALRVVQDTVPQAFIEQLRAQFAGQDIILQPVAAIEQTGRNKLPLAGAEYLAHQVGSRTGLDIVQATKPKRTAMNGLERIFARPQFDGRVEQGASYVLLDDTLTQGGTLAALAAYIENAGGKVAGMVTLTGKPYSAKIELSSPTLTKLRDRYGDIESTFRAATGHGFDGLTESEARYLTGFRQTDVIRDRIAAAGDAARQRDAARAPEQQDVSDPDALDFSRAGLVERLAGAANSVDALRLPAGYLVGDLFNQSGKISWWHKTIGTMDNLARRQPAFAAVYRAVQAFLGDVSRYAVQAADLAPTLLPKLENVADILGKNRKKALTAADKEAISAPIFEGTLTWARDPHGDPVRIAQLEADAAKLTTKQKADILLAKGVIDDGENQAWLKSPLDFYDSTINNRFEATQLRAGIVWSDAELREQFSLNDGQIALYRQFRAAIDKSLTNLTISEMVKLGGKDAKGMIEQAVAAPDLASAAELLRDHFIALAKLHPKQVNMHLDTASKIMDLADKGEDLMERGYAPLSRFGKYTVYVQEDEQQVYFGMFETQHEAARMVRQMQQEHPQATVTHGTVSEDSYKLFAGVSPETIELFGSMVGLGTQPDATNNEVYQTYLKLAKNNRSAMKRMIQRKGIAGFNEDAGRVLASFIYSNARLTAGNAHLGEIDEAITEIPKQQGELTDAAMQLREQIRNPVGKNRLGGLMFAQFLGGSIASAMVNLTQPVTMTLPFLSQYGGLTKAGARLASAVRDAAKGVTGDADLDKALQWAADEGIVAPQEVHYLQAQAAGKGALQTGDGTKLGNTRAALNNTMAKVQLGWGKLFAMAELANRRVTFIAAYRTAVQERLPDPARFAEEAVSQTQGTYNSGNKPVWARGTIGGVLMTFKQYSIGYLELLTRMLSAGEPGSPERAAGRRAALYMVAVLFLMGGADGLPFEQDLEDVIDGLMQRLGYNFSTKRAKQAFLTEVLGAGGADFALKGISSMPGMPVDVAGRFGMGNLIPGTGLLTKKDSYTQDLGELAGPAGDVAKRAFAAAGQALGGDLAGAALTASPAAVRNAAKGADMLESGAYRDGRGYKVNDTSTAEAVLKAVGFQPNSTANIQDAKGQALSMIAQNRMRSAEIAEHWAQGVANNKPEQVAEARAWRDDWNRKNPETPIRVNMPALAKRVRAMRQDVANRTRMTAPVAVRQAVRNELSEVRG